MILEIINKILFVLFFASCLNTLRHTYFFIQAGLSSTEEVPIKYRVSNISLLVLGISIAYILTVVFTGVKI